MNEVKLPALTGDSPLGILAAIGLLRLLDSFTDDSPRLRWDRTDLTAVLCGRHDNVEGIIVDLQSIVGSVPPGSSLPGVGPGFPPPGAAPDRLRVSQSELPQTAATLTGNMSPSERLEAERWLASLVTDLTENGGKVAISQFMAPFAKQSTATMLEKPLGSIRNEPDYLRQALVGWRRVAGVTGEYLDHRAMWDAAQDGSGSTGSMRGVPGATWLALMSYPLLRTTASRKRVLSSGWHVVRRNTRTESELRLPVWSQPLGTTGITVLLEHPVLDRPQQVVASRAREERALLETLGIIHVCRARRYKADDAKFAGVLTVVK